MEFTFGSPSAGGRRGNCREAWSRVDWTCSREIYGSSRVFSPSRPETSTVGHGVGASRLPITHRRSGPVIRKDGTKVIYYLEKTPRTSRQRVPQVAPGPQQVPALFPKVPRLGHKPSMGEEVWNLPGQVVPARLALENFGSAGGEISPVPSRPQAQGGGSLLCRLGPTARSTSRRLPPTPWRCAPRVYGGLGVRTLR